jgi:hypothetical protein
MSNSDGRPRISEAEAESLLTTIERLIKAGDDTHAQHVAELEKTIAGLHEVLRALATTTMKLADIKPPSDRADAEVVEAVVGEARKVMTYLEPPSH